MNSFRVGHIYIVRNKVNGKTYVGQTLGPIKLRWRRHCAAAFKGGCTLLHRAIRKYGAKNFTLRLVCKCTEPLLSSAERRFIVKHGSFSRDSGYNLTAGGEGGTPAAFVCRKISIANTGKKQSAECLARKAASLRRAYILDPTLRDRTGGSWRGKKRTSQDVANRRASMERHYRDPKWRAKIARKAKANWKSATHRARQTAGWARRRELKALA